MKEKTKRFIKNHPNYMRDYFKKYREDNREKIREYSKKYLHLYMKKYSKTSKYKNKRILSSKLYREKNPEKFKARYQLRNAIVKGIILKPEFCSKCNCKNPQ